MVFIIVIVFINIRPLTSLAFQKINKYKSFCINFKEFMNSPSKNPINGSHQDP